MERPYAEACEQNKRPILAVLREQLAAPGLVLEIGSGTGQHAVFFSAELPHLVWQPSDVAANLPGIRAWIAACPAPNLRDPLVLEVTQDAWPVEAADYAFSANTAHIMSERQVRAMLAGLGRILRPGGRFCLYGPFAYHGRHTAPSNAAFDASLRARDPDSGVRDVDDLARWAQAAGLVLAADYEMPVNNRTLVWEKRGR